MSGLGSKYIHYTLRGFLNDGIEPPKKGQPVTNNTITKIIDEQNKYVKSFFEEKQSEESAKKLENSINEYFKVKQGLTNTNKIGKEINFTTDDINSIDAAIKECLTSDGYIQQIQENLTNDIENLVNIINSFSIKNTQIIINISTIQSRFNHLSKLVEQIDNDIQNAAKNGIKSSKSLISAKQISAYLKKLMNIFDKLIQKYTNESKINLDKIKIGQRASKIIFNFNKDNDKYKKQIEQGITNLTVRDFLKAFNDVLSSIKGQLVTAFSGDVGEYSAAIIALKAMQKGQENITDNLTDFAKQAKKGQEKSSIVMDINKDYIDQNKLLEALGKNNYEINNGIITAKKSSQNKIDVEFVFKIDKEEQPLNLSVKALSYSPNDSSYKIHLMKASPLLYLLMNDKENNISSYYLNLNVKMHTNSNNNTSLETSQNIINWRNSINTIIKKTIFVEALSAAGLEKNYENNSNNIPNYLLVLFKAAGEAEDKAKIYSIKSIVNKILENDNSNLKGIYFSNFPEELFPNNWLGKENNIMSARNRITELLAYLNSYKISVIMYPNQIGITGVNN